MAIETPPYVLVMTLRGFFDYIGVTRAKGERNWLQKLLNRRRAR